MALRFLVTGGAGFIGSAVIRHLIRNTQHRVLNVDKLTYAGNLNSLKAVEKSDRYEFVQGDICDAKGMEQLVRDFRPNVVMHLAAESHVDKSISSPEDFLQTNIFGTFYLLEAVRSYWSSLSEAEQEDFRFHHVSTDEVYGDLANTEECFLETSPYSPSSPYSASKASSDHLVRAWGRTYSLPIVVTHCSNNYGPYHFPEKFIPRVILSALAGKTIPVFGDGRQIRDWLYVDDHAQALVLVATKGVPSQTYNIGGWNEKKNLEVVKSICAILDECHIEKPRAIESYSELISFVADRPGHDFRYAVDASKIEQELGWKPSENFESGLRRTVLWYLNNKDWWKPLLA